MKNNTEKIFKLLEKSYVGILLVIFGGIVLHAPLSVALSSLWPDYSLLIKSWKEILMLIAGFILLAILYKKKRFELMRDKLIIAIGIYALLHLIILFVYNNGLLSIIAGLMIDLRYLLFFCLVYFAMRLYPDERRLFITVGLGGAFVVLIFAVMQVFVLPNDILKYIGYSKETISPFLTVDQNSSFIRINSTMRGPNPLGAYAGMVLILITAAMAGNKINSPYGEKKWHSMALAVLSFGGLIALWASYSRSALISTLIAVILVLAVVNYRRLSTKFWLIFATIMIIIAGSIWAVRDTQFVSNVLLHENPTNIDNISSNEGHINSLSDGLINMIRRPMGEGVGSTGSASLLGDSPQVIENQYLFVANETGWIGLVLFLSIFGAVMIELWDKRRDWLALGLFASGISVALIGIFLPILADDTISIVWWGLAAIALFPERKVI